MTKLRKTASHPHRTINGPSAPPKSTFCTKVMRVKTPVIQPENLSTTTTATTAPATTTTTDPATTTTAITPTTTTTTMTTVTTTTTTTTTSTATTNAKTTAAHAQSYTTAYDGVTLSHLHVHAPANIAEDAEVKADHATILGGHNNARKYSHSIECSYGKGRYLRFPHV
eukprot:CAMPEP_0183709284 /NCGR_PEP_ID=MMETSP0737-20130205/5369_1 /TAXON_ID=385413 /ORGANISM="Thalassiosira miniscula, Strain CCMP1093" /LENGTH=168 /DNA_ID=CAMNT_0025937343 /DNA_START=65 /DNA_END=571 /DNA_ORIENTATION=+